MCAGLFIDHYSIKVFYSRVKFSRLVSGFFLFYTLRMAAIQLPKRLFSISLVKQRMFVAMSPPSHTTVCNYKIISQSTGAEVFKISDKQRLTFVVLLRRMFPTGETFEPVEICPQPFWLDSGRTMGREGEREGGREGGSDEERKRV